MLSVHTKEPLGNLDLADPGVMDYEADLVVKDGECVRITGRHCNHELTVIIFTDNLRIFHINGK